MKKTLTQQDINENPILSDRKPGDVLTVKGEADIKNKAPRKKKGGGVTTQDDKPKPGEHPPPPVNP